MAILNTDSDTLMARLAHSDYKEALHQTLDRLASLPPEVAVPTVVALHRWITEDAAAQGGGADVAQAIAHALHAHGNVFLALTDAVGDDRLRTALLPLPEKAAAAHALRNAAHDDPPTAHALAHALRDRSWSDAIRWLLAMPPNHAVAILCAMDDAVRCEIIDEIAAASPNAVSLLAPDPIAALVRAGWDALSCKARQLLHTHPPFADLPPTNKNVGACIYRRRR